MQVCDVVFPRSTVASTRQDMRIGPMLKFDQTKPNPFSSVITDPLLSNLQQNAPSPSSRGSVCLDHRANLLCNSTVIANYRGRLNLREISEILFQL